ncbi:hypothetical protein ACLOJK_018176 [Asimina triloba]
MDTNNNAKDEEEDVPAQVQIWKYIFGIVDMAAMKCIVELGIPDLMDAAPGGAMSLPQLAVSTACVPSILHRIMRFLVHRRVFQEQRRGLENECYYALTPLSRCLTKQAMANLLLLESSHVMLAPWHGLTSYARAGAPPPFVAAHGEDLWSYTANHAHHSQLFNDAMACDARNAVGPILDGCRGMLEGLSTVVDVGGGNGTLLRGLVEACPWIRGINFDLPHVVGAAPVSPAIVHVGGDMFNSIPKADAVLLKFILHDWGDEECIRILRKCKEAVPQDTGKVIIIEAVIDDEDGDRDVGGAGKDFSHVKLILDMAMMAHTSNGKERIGAEWEAILSQAGFTRFTINHIPRAVSSVIQAYP